MTGQLALCPAPVRRALPRANESAELAAAVRRFGSIRNTPVHVLLNIWIRQPDERLTLTVRRWSPW